MRDDFSHARAEAQRAVEDLRLMWSHVDHLELMRLLGELCDERVVEVPELPQSRESIQRYFAIRDYCLREMAIIDDQVKRLESATAEIKFPRQLAPPPRAVPGSYVSAELLSLSWWMKLICVILVGCSWVDEVDERVLAAATAITVVLWLAHATRNIRILGRCRLVQEIARRFESTGRSSRNWPFRVVRGWKVERQAFSGQGTRTEISFIGKTGSVETHRVRGGPPYEGVLLEDVDGKIYSLLVFGSAPHPDASGKWNPALQRGSLFRSVAFLFFLVLAWGAPYVLKAYA